MILLDTSVLVYAVGDEHPLREPCRNLLRWHSEGRIEAGTTVEAIQEFAHVRGRRRPRADAAALARHYADALTLVATGPDDVELGMSLYEQHPQLGATDSVLAAVAVNHRVEALVSADRAFEAVSRLRWVDPIRPDLERVVAGQGCQLA